VQLLKGASAWRLFRVKGKFALRYPRRHFWSRGNRSETQTDCVENQEMHMGFSTQRRKSLNLFGG